MAYDDRLADRIRDVLVGEDGVGDALRKPHVRQMDFTGRPMTGMVYVAPAGLRGVALRNWVAKAVAFARSLPPKEPKRR